MKRVAVIGAGISGLAAAYYLSRDYEVHVFEKSKRIGGHTNTVQVDSPQGPLAIDTGFIVHNEKTYPKFCSLMRELGVATSPSDMSFGVYSPETGFEYSSRGARGFFAAPSNALRPAHWTLLREILRFNREAPRLLDSSEDEPLTLGEFVRAGGYKSQFLERYLYPMVSAVWSVTPQTAEHFAARTLVQFFANHGMLGINTHPQWKVIQGGSNRYLKPLTEAYARNISVGAKLASVTRCPCGVVLRFAEGGQRTFDQVVFACHGDQVLPLLADASEAEYAVFSQFRTSQNVAVLHTDSRSLPRRAAARASWNYRLGSSGQVTLTYHMNRLQSLNAAEDYCVTLNPYDEIDPNRVICRIEYRHPIFDYRALSAQREWHRVSGVRNTHYCGAYWSYGFHEDGINSALRVANAMGVAA